MRPGIDVWWRHPGQIARRGHGGSSLEVVESIYINRMLDVTTGKGLRWSRVAYLSLVPKFAGSNPTEAVGFFQGEKILSTPFFGWEVKPSVPCRIFTACKRFLNVTWKSGIFRQNSSAISRPCSSTFGCYRISRRRLVAKVGTFEKKKVHKHLHLWPLGPHRRRLAVRFGTSKGSTISQYGCSTFGALATEVQ